MISFLVECICWYFYRRYIRYCCWSVANQADLLLLISVDTYTCTYPRVMFNHHSVYMLNYNDNGLLLIYLRLGRVWAVDLLTVNSHWVKMLLWVVMFTYFWGKNIVNCYILTFAYIFQCVLLIYYLRLSIFVIVSCCWFTYQVYICYYVI